MNFDLTNEQEALRQRVRDFAEQEVKPVARENDEDQHFDVGLTLKMAELGLMVNTQEYNTITYGETKSAGTMLQLNRKLNADGRNITLQGNVNYSDKASNILSLQNVHLFLIKDMLGNDSTYQTNRYNLMPTRNWNYSLQATYSEPIAMRTYLQFSYKYEYSFNKSNRQTYDFSNLGEDFFANNTPEYRRWDSYLNRLDSPLDNYLDDNLSRKSEYHFQPRSSKDGIKMVSIWRMN